MNLKTLVSEHQQAFKEKVLRALAAKTKHSASSTEQSSTEQSSTEEGQVAEKYGEVVERYVQEKYKGVEQAVSKILEFKRPVVLSIRRDPCSEEVCRICERDQPKIEELRRLYGDKIGFYEIFDSSPEAALYHILHRGGGKGEGEKLLPLTAVIHNGEVKKYWSGRPVEVGEYRKYLDLPDCQTILSTNNLMKEK